MVLLGFVELLTMYWWFLMLVKASWFVSMMYLMLM
jgi:hypothetical protein